MYYFQGTDPNTTSPGPIPVLTEAQIQAISEIAARMAKTLPPLEPKPKNVKKQISKEIMVITSAHFILTRLPHHQNINITQET